MKFEIFKFKKVTSTNDIAINLIKKKKKEKGYVCADIQTRGRGTHGKKWISSAGNLFGTIFFQLKNNFPPFNEFSIINPVIISSVIKSYCKREDISIKFPNDVFVNKKKICGILQELVTWNNKKFLIIGIGLNIVSNPKIRNKYESTNIFIETKKKPRINEIINLIISSYEKFFYNLDSYKYINYRKKVQIMSLEFKT